MFYSASFTLTTKAVSNGVFFSFYNLGKIINRLEKSDKFRDMFPQNLVNSEQEQQMFDSYFQQLSLHTDFILNTTIWLG